LLLHLSFCGQLAVFFIKLDMLPSSGSEFIFFILLISLLAPSDIPLFGNMGIEVFDTLGQLFVGVLK